MAVPYSPSYIEHLGSILPQWPEFRDLYEFLSSPAQTDSQNCKALIIDQLDNGQIDPRRFGTDSFRLRAKLSQRLPRIRTRIVILQYAEAKSVSRELALEFGFYQFLHASVLILPSDDLGESGSPDSARNWTVLILLRSPFNGCKSSAFELESLSRDSESRLSNSIPFSADISERYITCLQRPTGTEETLRTPLELIQPLCKIIALEIKHHFYTSSQRWEYDDVISLLDVPEAATRLKGLDYDFRANLFRISMDMDITALRETISTITHPGGSCLSAPMVVELESKILWQRLRHDLQCLHEETARNKERFEAYEARCLNRFNLTAAIESLEQSRSIGRLTTLAFIFIPLSFMTSFFGMNVAEFGTGDIHLSLFVVSTVAVLAIITFVWLLSGWIEHYLTTVSSNFYGLRLRLPVLRKLASISPMATFWLVCFAISHSPRMFQTYLLDTGVWGVLGLGVEWDQPRFDEEENLRRWQSTISPFWQRRAMAIIEMTKTRGWHRKSWVQRWRVRR
ncbi:hypothetical protein FOQG_16981 [Fusarium oxysporum f. sp. raphani 54005]|uniref:Magnesium transport protein CorA n=1 Tax=Fusarium oxysporum f. sp. raphani 54005 TaxID=1089458 RepID=X0BIN3_FUSOX|nr:hypothetical protein FOQG_16981 [Fusarium oxysporum f. sp. raphani 54005]